MRSLIPLLIAALLFVGCSSSKPTPASTATASSTQPSVQVSMAEVGDSLLQVNGQPNHDIAHESFLRGLYLRNIEKGDIAEHFYKRALAHEPGNRFLAFDLVELLSENGKSKEALAIAKKAILFKGEPEGREYFMLARLYRESGIIDSARTYYEKTIQENPEHFRALYEYSVVLEMVQDYKSLARVYGLLLPLLNYPRPMVDKQLLLLKLKGNDSLVLDFLQNAYVAHPEVELGRELGDVFMEQKRYDEAVQLADQMVGLDTLNMESHQYLVKLAIKAGKAPEAIAAQKRLYFMDSTNLDELEKLGMLEFEAGAADSSTRHFKQLVVKRPGDHLGYFYLSNLYAMRGELESAMESIQRSIALKPDAIAYRNHQAALYSQQKNFEKAHQVLDETLVLHKNHPLIMQYKGNTYIHEALLLEALYPVVGSPEAQKVRAIRLQALTWFQKAWSADTLANDILFDLAADYERLDSIPKARALFEKLLKQEPTHHQTLNYLGYMLVDRKIDVDLGGRMIDSALVLSPGNEAYLDSKAWHLLRKGDAKGAQEILQYLVTELKAEDAVIWEHLAEAYELLNQTDAAKAAWQQVLRFNPRHERAMNRTAAPLKP